MSNAALLNDTTEGLYETVIQAMDQGFCLIEVIFDEADKPVDYRFLQINPVFSRLSGLRDAVGKTIRTLVPEIEAFWVETYGNVALSGEAVRFEHGSAPLNATFDVFATRVGGQASRKVAILFNNITERKRVEAALRDNEARLRTAVQITGITFAQLDERLRYRWVYNTHPDFDAGAVLGRRDDELLAPELAQPFVEIKQRVLESKTGARAEIVVPLTNGQNVYDFYAEPLYDPSGEVVGVTTAALDITQQHRAQEQVRNALREKDVLLKELYHRVKNNLQITSSLITLQRDQVPQPEVRRALQESINRIKSMALIHEQLYQSGDLEEINFKAYLGSLVEHLRQAYHSPAGCVTIETDCVDIGLPLDTAVPCGLIVNELVSNAVKHAFPDGHCGTIRVSVKCVQDGRLSLEVADDGVGLPEGVSPHGSSSLGLLLVTTLCEQLGGEQRLERGQGTVFQILFKASAC